MIWQNRLAALVVQPDGHLLGANDRFGSKPASQIKLGLIFKAIRSSAEYYSLIDAVLK